LVPRLEGKHPASKSLGADAEKGGAQFRHPASALPVVELWRDSAPKPLSLD
jgi:hypothetical protein